MPYVKPGIYTQEVDVSVAPSKTVFMNIVKSRVEKKERSLEGDVRFNFDVQKLEIFTSEDMWRQVESFVEDNISPCPKCGVRPAEDCGYSTLDPWSGEHDCEAPDVDGEPCEYCNHLHCSLCRMKEAYNFKEEEFNV